jgi:hypothetical protein
VTVLAIQQIRRMRGGAQSHLMLGADGNAWVVKFQNNPQHLRVLPNELLGTRLGALIGLTVPHCDVVEVSPWLIAETKEMEMEFGERRERCTAGLQFGSQLVGGLMPGHVADYLPEEQLMEVRNLRFIAKAGKSVTVRRSSTRGFASMRGNGASRTRRSAECTRGIWCIGRWRAGRVSNRG